jgi:hypothetical protein
MREIKAKETVFRQDSVCEEKIKDPLETLADTLEVPLDGNNLY